MLKCPILYYKVCCWILPWRLMMSHGRFLLTNTHYSRFCVRLKGTVSKLDFERTSHCQSFHCGWQIFSTSAMLLIAWWWDMIKQSSGIPDHQHSRMELGCIWLHNSFITYIEGTLVRFFFFWKMVKSIKLKSICWQSVNKIKYFCSTFPIGYGFKRFAPIATA